jgi:hypothetical protein
MTSTRQTNSDMARLKHNKNQEKTDGKIGAEELDSIGEAERLYADEAEAAFNEIRQDVQPPWEEAE